MKLNSLVLYKNTPAMIIGNHGDKLEIKLANNTTKLVRVKDIQLIHSGPISNLHSLKENIQPKEDLKEVCQLIEGSCINLGELAEVIFGENIPQTAWSVWELLKDGIYFKGSIEAIQSRTEQEINESLAKRNAKAAAEKERENLVYRIKNSQILPDDAKFMHEIEQFTLGKIHNCRLMEELGIEQTPEKAHDILLRTKYWNNFVNPYPDRFGISLKKGSDTDPENFLVPEEKRRDLTSLETFAIDDEGCNDPDDALSFDGEFLYVHIADVASLIKPSDKLDISAMEQSSSLYLPEKTLPMLPDAITKLFGLGLADTSPAFTFMLELDSESNAKIIEMFPSLIRVKRLTYEEAEKEIDTGNFDKLWKITKQFKDKRMASGAVEIELPEAKIKVDGEKIKIQRLPVLKSRELVEESMLMTGEAVAAFAVENNICIPFSSQNINENVAFMKALPECFHVARS